MAFFLRKSTRAVLGSEQRPRRAAEPMPGLSERSGLLVDRRAIREGQRTDRAADEEDVRVGDGVQPLAGPRVGIAWVGMPHGADELAVAVGLRAQTEGVLRRRRVARIAIDRVAGDALSPSHGAARSEHEGDGSDG
jgi:hypothetical protein